MPALTSWVPRLQTRLDELRARHGVPGAVSAVLVGDHQAVAASGVANVATGVEVTPDTVFQLGSVSKVYTATLALQLAQAGLVELETPVRAALRGLRLGDDAATLEITPWHLLTHTSGIQGDHLADHGRGSDALARYVAGLCEVDQVHPPDELYSYCNTGYGILGRLVEVVGGDPYERALRRRLLRPLGLHHTFTLAEEAILHRVAAGHDTGPDGAPVRQARWTLWRSTTPIGGIMATAADVLAFGRLHLRHGRGPDGRDLLAGEAVEAMQQHQVDHPDGLAARGLGWELSRWGDEPVVGHDGDSLGQRAGLRLVPGRDAAVAVMANAANGAALVDDLVRWIAADLLELEVPAVPAPDGDATVDHVRHVGVYDRLHQRVEVTAGGPGALALTLRPDHALEAAGQRPATVRLEALDGERFVGPSPRTGLPTVAVFLDPDEAGQSQYLHLAGRAHRRTA